MDINLLRIVATFIVSPKKKLLDWIPAHKVAKDYIEQDFREIFETARRDPFYDIQNGCYKVYFKDTLVKIINNINIDTHKCSSNILSESHDINIIRHLEENPIKIDWDVLSGNSKAIHILEKYLENINWYMLSENPKAINILKNNINKIKWKYIKNNPSIYTIDNVLYNKDIIMKANNIDVFE